MTRWRVVELWTPGPPYALEYQSNRTGDWFPPSGQNRFWTVDAAEQKARSQARSSPHVSKIVRVFELED